MPIAAVTNRHEIFDTAQAFVAGTYAGHPAACAAGVKTLEIMARDRVLEHATELGAYGMKRLQAMQEKFPIIGEVRGKGLWLTAEFIKDPKTREKNFEAAALVNEHCLKNGLYYIHDSISWFVRIQPPLTIERPLFEQGMDILEDAIAAANAGR